MEINPVSNSSMQPPPFQAIMFFGTIVMKTIPHLLQNYENMLPRNSFRSKARVLQRLTKSKQANGPEIS